MNKSESNIESSEKSILSDELLFVLREIDETKRKLSDLKENKRCMEELEKIGRIQAARKSRAIPKQEWIIMLEMAARGASISEIAIKTGSTKNTIRWKIQRAWKRAFRGHYEKNFNASLGLLTSLRATPPSFSTANAE